MPPMVPVPQERISCPSFFAPSINCARVWAKEVTGVSKAPIKLTTAIK